MPLLHPGCATMLKRFRVLSLSAALIFVPPSGFAAQAVEQPARSAATPTAEAMILDGLLYRPLALVSTLIGTGVFIVTLPFSAAGGNVHDAGERLVLEPARDTFTRCLGCFPQYDY